MAFGTEILVLNVVKPSSITIFGEPFLQITTFLLFAVPSTNWSVKDCVNPIALLVSSLFNTHSVDVPVNLLVPSTFTFPVIGT